MKKIFHTKEGSNSFNYLLKFLVIGVLMVLFSSDLSAARYSSSSVTQITGNVVPGSVANQIIKVTVVGNSTGILDNWEITTCAFQMKNTNNADVLRAKLYINSTDNFATATQTGSTINNPTGTITFTVNSGGIGNNSRFLYLVFDLSNNAPCSGNVVDALVPTNGLVIGTVLIGGNPGSKTPSPNDPAGDRPIVGINISPTISISASTTTTCAGLPINFTSSITNGGLAPTYNWLINGIPSGVTTANFSSTSLSDADQISCIVTSSNLCATVPSTTSNSIAVTINATPTSSITPTGNLVFCSLDATSQLLTSITNGGAPTYQWKRNGTAIGGANGPTYLATLTGNYTVLISNAGCNNESPATSLTFNVSPTVSATATPSSVCPGGSVNLSSSGNVNSTYTGSQTNSTSQAIPDFSVTGISSTINLTGLPQTNLAGATITVSVNINHGNNDDIEIYLVRPGGSITTNNLLTTNLLTSVPGQSIRLSNDNGGSGDNYTNVTFSDAAPIAISTLGGVNTTPITGNYRPEELFSTLTGDPNGVWTLRVLDDLILTSGTLVNWNITIVMPSGLSYTWTSNPPGYAASGRDAYVSSVNGTTTYTVTATDLTTGCTASASTTVTVNAIPHPVITPGDSVLCAGQGLFLHVIDTGAFAGGYPAGTNVEWIGLGIILPVTDSLNTAGNGNLFQARVILPNNCEGTSSVRSVLAKVVSISPVVKHATCNLDNGSVVAHITAGTAPYRYIWKQGLIVIRDTSTTSIVDSIYDLTADTYTLEIFDNDGLVVVNEPSCSSGIQTFVLNQIIPVSVAAGVTAATCNGNADGVAVANAVNGTPPYQYLWSTGATTQSAFNLIQNIYTVTVTDASGCSAFTTALITQPDPLAISFDVTNISCNGSNDGAAIANVTGGTYPYTYTWFDFNFSPIGTNSPNLNNLAPGTYYLFIEDANACGFNSQILISEPPVLELSISGTAASCFGYANGTGTVIPTGGTPLYNYLWSNGETSAEAIALSAGTNHVTVTDANGCQAGLPLVTGEPDLILPLATGYSDVACADGLTSIAINGSGGTAPYTGEGIYSVGAGTYNYTLTDTIGCTGQVTVTISILDNEAPIISDCPLTITQCNSTVSWIEPTATDNCSLVSFTTDHASGSVFSQGTTTVTYTATDNNGNSSTCSFDVIITSTPIWYVDADGDNYGVATGTLVSCIQPTGYVANADDCNDLDAGINPAAFDIPDNGIDENCDGTDATCDDNNVCTDDLYDALLMICSHTLISVDDNNVCTLDACDPIDGPSHAAISADDDNVCTLDDCDPVTGPYHTAIDISDNNLCTIDDCDPVTGPFYIAANIGDNNVCTDDACDPLSGISHTPILIDDNSVCTIDACDPIDGVSHTAISIDDDNVCTLDACDPVDGPSHAAISVDDTNECTLDACDPIGGPSHELISTDDNNVCTTDACDPILGMSHTPISVDDDDLCTLDNCDPVTGPYHTIISSDDNNVCTTDACDPILGMSHTPISVDDNNVCTIDACDPITGPSHDLISTDDSNVCTTDACDPVTGMSHTAISIDDNNFCTTDACDPVSGVSHTPLDTDDNNVCTIDACEPSTGNFSHIAVSINDNDACTIDGCDPISGVYHTFDPSVYYADNDGDGFGAGTAIITCPQPAGTVVNDIDCNDLIAAINPLATEVCNSIDDDCDGDIDEGSLSGAGIINGISSQCIPVQPGFATFTVPIVPGATSYSWTLPNNIGITNGQGTNSITVGWSALAVQDGIIGQVCVFGYNACGSGASSCMNIAYTYTSPVTPPSISGSARACPGDVVTYSVSTVARASFYTWTVPAGVIILSGQGTNVVTAQVNAGFTGGNLGVAAGNACGVSPVRSRALVLNILSAPVSISGPVNGVCSTNNIAYTASDVAGATTYTWTVPAGVIISSGQGTKTAILNFTASFVSGLISVTANNACGSGNARSISVSSFPAQPNVISGPIAICPGALGVIYSVPTIPGTSVYTWTVPAGASIASGQGTKTISVNWGTVPATGQVINVRGSNSCGIGFIRTLSGISINASNCLKIAEAERDSYLNMNVWPNPAHDNLYISFNMIQSDNARILISDLTGRTVYDQSKSYMEGLNQIQIDLNKLQSGLYFISVSTGNDIQKTRVMIE